MKNFIFSLTLSLLSFECAAQTQTVLPPNGDGTLYTNIEASSIVGTLTTNTLPLTTTIATNMTLGGSGAFVTNNYTTAIRFTLNCTWTSTLTGASEIALKVPGLHTNDEKYSGLVLTTTHDISQIIKPNEVLEVTNLSAAGASITINSMFYEVLAR